MHISTTTSSHQSYCSEPLPLYSFIYLFVTLLSRVRLHGVMSMLRVVRVPQLYAFLLTDSPRGGELKGKGLLS